VPQDAAQEWHAHREGGRLEEGRRNGWSCDAVAADVQDVQLRATCELRRQHDHLILRQVQLDKHAARADPARQRRQLVLSRLQNLQLHTPARDHDA
jgi:hypothetical protein